MTRVTIEFDDEGFELGDDAGQWISGTYNGEQALISARLDAFGEDVYFYSLHRNDAMADALVNIGVYQ